MCNYSRTQRKANILLMKIPQKLMDMERKAYILPNEELEEVNLGANLRNLGPILINSQLSVQIKEQLVELLKKYENLWAWNPSN